jgi:hypothetical protein
MGYPRILLCLLWLYRYFASWAISHQHRLLWQCQNTALPSLAISMLCILSYLPLGLLCLLGYFASWATLPLGLLLPLGLGSWATLPLGLASWAILPLGLFQHVATWAMSHRHCLLWQCRYTDMPLGPCHYWALVSMQNDKLCYYARPGYSVKPDMIRDMIFVSFEIAVSIYYWARIGDNWRDYRMPWYAGMPK